MIALYTTETSHEILRRVLETFSQAETPAWLGVSDRRIHRWLSRDIEIPAHLTPALREIIGVPCQI